MKVLSFRGSSASFKAFILALLWLGVISLLHASVNREKTASQKVRMGYMPVISNLAAPLVDAATAGSPVHFEALKFGSFAEIAEAFRSGHIQAAFIIAPLAVALSSQGVPLKIVYIGNRHESTLVVRKDESAASLAEMSGKTLAVPIRYSGHLLAVKRYLRHHGMDPRAVRILEIPPPDMPSALVTGDIHGYFVGEPFASRSIQSGVGRRLLDAEEIWPGFVCNVLIVRDELIRSHPERVGDLVKGCVRSGIRVRENFEETLGILSRYWGQDPQFVRYVFENPPNRFRYDLCVPVRSEIEELVREMETEGLISASSEVGDFLEDRYARAAVEGLREPLLGLTKR
ncbi:MAG TPA: ABC transporter substrate-binding protein [Syntrophobacteraceae bacterium]|nr:ABC transporter substrate-binding protein [Syntrophobacteraceae bacterium]